MQTQRGRRSPRQHLLALSETLLRVLGAERLRSRHAGYGSCNSFEVRRLPHRDRIMPQPDGRPRPSATASSLANGVIHHSDAGDIAAAG